MPSRYPAVLNAAAAALFLALLLTAAAHAQGAPAASFRSLKEIREQGIVMQKWENSCAAASVATVLTYGFRDPVSEREAAEHMLAQTDGKQVRAQGGFSLLDLKNFVESRGYAGSAYRNMSFDDLKVFHAPIVPISMKGYHHYVVFNGTAGNTVRLADPAFGHRTLTIAEFERIWLSGMAFVVTRKETSK